MIGAYLTDTVTWVKDGGTDQWNTPLAPTTVSVKARVKDATRNVLNFAGEEVVSDGEVLVRDKPGQEDKFDLGDGVKRRIVAIHAVKGFTLSHYRVYLG